MSGDAVFASRPEWMRALLTSFVPSATRLSDEELATVLANSDRLIAGRPASVKRQLVLAIRVLDALAFLRHFRGLAGLDAKRRTAFLERLQDSRVLKLRLAVWGLRTLLFAGYYGDPDRQQQLGYRPSLVGWDDKPVGDRS